MTEAIIVGLITLAGTALTVWGTNRKTQKGYEVSQAVMEEKIENLTAEVRKHNGFAEKIPVIEEKLRAQEERINELRKEK